ncbi:galectin [Serendipita vermifera]|nr:galectin [Serendipita vermifera]
MFYLIPLTKTVALNSELKKDGIVIFQSSKLDLNPSPTGKRNPDLTSLRLINENDILLAIGIRRAENTITFTSYLNNTWGNMETISLHSLFRTNNPTIMVYDHGDHFQILIDYHTVKYFTKRSPKVVTSLGYYINPEQISPFSNPIAANTYSSMAKLLATSD